jgi:hydroxymethylbilane synthase
MKIRIATRKSPLALVQTEWVARRLREAEPDTEIGVLEMVTMGDRMKDVSLASVGGKGLFVSELEQALLEGRADLAVHSLKDLPAELADGLLIASIPEREDPRDVLVTPDGLAVDDLCAGDRIGTSSARRTLQLRRQRNDLQFALCRGSVGTRLQKLEQGEYAAIVLAYAGLRRLGLADRPLWPIPIELSVPAVGQGALALQVRTDDAPLRELVQRIEHPQSRLCIEAERAFLATLGGDCHTPLAGHAQLSDQSSRLRFDGLVGAIDDERLVRSGAERYRDHGHLTAADARELGIEVAERLLSQGARELIEEAAERSAKEHDPRRRPM